MLVWPYAATAGAKAVRSNESLRNVLPTEISVATGGYEKRGSLFAWGIVVNKDNPLNEISLDQLERTFGSERSGGWELRDNNWL